MIDFTNLDVACFLDHDARIGDMVRMRDKVTYIRQNHMLLTQEDLDKYRELCKNPTSGEH